MLAITLNKVNTVVFDIVVSSESLSVKGFHLIGKFNRLYFYMNVKEDYTFVGRDVQVAFNSKDMSVYEIKNRIVQFNN
jgi:hypothetical protein